MRSVTIALALAGLTSLGCADIEPFDDSELRLPPPGAAASQAFTELNDLAESIAWDNEDAIHSRDADWRAARLAENAEVQDGLERVLRGPAFRFPPPSIDGELVWKTDQWRRLAALLLLSAEDALARGEPDAAEATFHLALEFGQRVEAGQGGAVGYLIGHALSEQAFRWARENASALPALSLREIDRSQSTEALKDAYRVEYQYMSTALDSIVESSDPFGGFRVPLRHPSSYMFQPERTRRSIHDTYLAWLSELDRPCHERAFGVPQELSFLDYVKPNSAGRIIMQVAIPSLERAGFADCNHVALHSGTTLAMSLVRYESRHGRLPATLDELVPEHLVGIPEDPFASDRSLRYSAEARVVYSVGENLQDDGGVEDLDEVIEIPVSGSP